MRYVSGYVRGCVKACVSGDLSIICHFFVEGTKGVTWSCPSGQGRVGYILVADEGGSPGVAQVDRVE